MGETRVDLLHLLEDLRDAYPCTLEETILTEVIANSLDSGASQIEFRASPEHGSLTVLDNGSGMHRRDLVKYHDVASTTKTRGQGIGFAGVGMKLGLLVCEEVLTETKRGNHHIATSWHLSSRHRAPWKWVPPPGFVQMRGTAVRLTFHNRLSPLLDPGFLEESIGRHFQPLFDPLFDPLLTAHYPKGIVIIVNGIPLKKAAQPKSDQAPLEIRLLRKRKPSALGYVYRSPLPMPADEQGIAISTFGKVIKRGWDWLGLMPASPECIAGLIEVPALAECLTLNKGDFIRVGSRGSIYLSYRKAVQEAVSRQLAVWGDTRDAPDESRARVPRPLERDLRRVLEDLSDEFPLLESLVERQSGGQKRLPLGFGGDAVEAHAVISDLLASRAEQQGAEPEERIPEADMKSGSESEGHEPTVMKPPAEGESALPETLLPEKGGQRRPARFGLGIQFENREDLSEIGRLVESTVLVNVAHPAYKRAEASRSMGYHLALTVAMALAPLAAEPAMHHAFITTFLARWGEALQGTSRRKLKKKDEVTGR